MLILMLSYTFLKENVSKPGFLNEYLLIKTIIQSMYRLSYVMNRFKIIYTGRFFFFIKYRTDLFIIVTRSIIVTICIND